MLISINDLDRAQLFGIFDRAAEIKKNGFQKTLDGKIIACLFFEPSTRTKMSFETAVLRTGAQVLGFSPEHSSLKKGETLEDTIRMVSAYADLIVIRHSEEGAAARAAKASSVPVINAGDGKSEHPTQTLLDLFTIFEDNGSLEDFSITLAGDLKYSRTIHSMVYALNKFCRADVKLASPEALQLSGAFADILGSPKSTHSIQEGLDSDYFYMTRVQKERFPNPEDAHYEDDWILTGDLCRKHAKENTKIMHPLPRVNEIAVDVDDTKYQLYFEQAENGLYVRAALLEMRLL